MQKSSQPLNTTGSNLPPFFAGLLPEGLRLNALKNRLKTSADDLFTLFAAAGEHVIGDVYSKSEQTTAVPTAVPALKKIDFREYLATLLSSDSYERGEDSIAGVQEKISASMISFPLNIARDKHAFILKLDPADKPGLVNNELHSMTLAQKCGLNTAKVKLVRDGNSNAGLLIQRFDREYDEKNSCMQMHHQEDACQFLNRYPADKYRLSLNEIAEGISAVASAPTVLILQLLRLYCFSYLLGNGDLHAKNISLMVRHGSTLVELTPAYDLICTLIYGDHNMAIKIDGRDDNIRRATIMEFARRFGLPSMAITEMLDRLLAAFSKHQSILEKIAMGTKQRAFLKKTIQKRLADLS